MLGGTKRAVVVAGCFAEEQKGAAWRRPADRPNTLSYVRFCDLTLQQHIPVASTWFLSRALRKRLQIMRESTADNARPLPEGPLPGLSCQGLRRRKGELAERSSPDINQQAFRRHLPAKAISVACL
jgi:hypothetical protein